MSKIKTIQFRLNLKGNGIVNYDSTEQRWIHNNNNTGLPSERNENVNYAKKNFYKTGKVDERGRNILEYKIKISSDALKKAIFKNEIIATNPNLMHHDALLYNYISSPVALLKGWMFAKDDDTIKKKGALNITDAEQICNAMSNIDTFARAEIKESKEDEDSKSGTTFFKKEKIGKIEYFTEGAIDIAALQLVSCDQVLDRYSFNPDNFELYKDFFTNHFGDDDIKLSYYKLKSSSIDLEEYGIKLNDKHIKKMVKLLLENILEFNIEKNGSNCTLSNLEVRLVNDPVVQNSSNSEGWVNLETKEDIDNLLNISFYDFYEEVDIQESIKKREEFEVKKKKLQIEAKEKSNEKKSLRKTKKEAETSDVL